VFRPPRFGTPPSTLEVDVGIDKVNHRAGRSINDHGSERSRCDGRVKKRLREGLFASNSPSILRRDCMAPLLDADQPRHVGTPVRHERAVYRERLPSLFLFAFYNNCFLIFILIRKMSQL
jgi:hypothetical protein